MLSEVSWIGIDFAFTMMNPLTMHHSVVIPRMYEMLGKPEQGPEKLRRWYSLRDSMGSPKDPPHQKVRLLKEYSRGRLHSEVFDDDPRAIELYAEMEITERKPPPGLGDALSFLKGRGKQLAVVSEVSSVEGALTLEAFLRGHRFSSFFDEMITPAGRFAPDGKLLDGVTFKGSNKKEGTIYGRLASYLDAKGIHAEKRAMVGDDPKQDIDAAKKYGFVTILYKGVVDRGITEKADLVIADWKDLRSAL